MRHRVISAWSNLNPDRQLNACSMTCACSRVHVRLGSLKGLELRPRRPPCIAFQLEISSDIIDSSSLNAVHGAPCSEIPALQRDWTLFPGLEHVSMYICIYHKMCYVIKALLLQKHFCKSCCCRAMP